MRGDYVNRLIVSLLQPLEAGMSLLHDNNCECATCAPELVDLGHDDRWIDENVLDNVVAAAEEK